MNRKQRKRKLQQAKAHQAQSKGHLEKAPLSLKDCQQIIKEMNTKYGSNSQTLPKEFGNERIAKAANSAGHLGNRLPLTRRLTWYYAAYLRLLTFWRLICGRSTSVK